MREELVDICRRDKNRIAMFYKDSEYQLEIIDKLIILGRYDVIDKIAGQNKKIMETYVIKSLKKGVMKVGQIDTSDHFGYVNFALNPLYIFPNDENRPKDMAFYYVCGQDRNYTMAEKYRAIAGFSPAEFFDYPHFLPSARILSPRPYNMPEKWLDSEEFARKFIKNEHVDVYTMIDLYENKRDSPLKQITRNLLKHRPKLVRNNHTLKLLVEKHVIEHGLDRDLWPYIYVFRYKCINVAECSGFGRDDYMAAANYALAKLCLNEARLLMSAYFMAPK